MKQTLLERARQIWRRYNAYLPEGLRNYIIRKRRDQKARSLSYLSDLKGLNLKSEDMTFERSYSRPKDRQNGKSGEISQAPKKAETIKKVQPTDEEQRARGMGDDPNTRINLSFGYLSGLVRWLAESDYEVMTYNDLAGPFEHGAEGEEFSQWIAAATERGAKSVLLQYDVDARPDITGALMKVHMECGIPGNAMIFRKKMFDWKLRRHGIAEIDEAYQLDLDLLEQFQKSGGLVGYHCNAFERAGGNMERAIEIFHEDVAALRQHLDIKFFSMHGGFVGPDGSCNALMNIQPYLESLDLTWVHNGHSIYFHSNWADGGACNPPYRNESSDPLDFILSSATGQRTRLLFHPQNYYDFTNSHFDYPVLHDTKWVQETRKLVKAGDFNDKQYWAGRYQEARESIDTYKALLEASADEQPVFVNGMSRSGTTLLVSMFDAHPEGAMAYESYPHYLYLPSDDGVLTVEEFIYVYQTLMNYSDNENEAFKLLDRAPIRNLRLFAAVTSWTGMSLRETGELLRAYLVDHHRIPDAREALKIVAASARYKVKAEGARFWGSKCQGNFQDYFDLWPQARIIYIMRNGLDILASQKTNGAFNPDPEKLGKSWRDNYKNFIAFQDRHPDYNMTLVNYEKLVSNPEASCQAMCEAIDFNYHPMMIRQNEVETTLVKQPRGQLSVDRVQQPIDTSSIGRWREILSQQEIDAFLKGCGGTDMFEKYGLEWEL